MKKSMLKKVMAVILAGALTVAMGISAFAEETTPTVVGWEGDDTIFEKTLKDGEMFGFTIKAGQSFEFEMDDFTTVLIIDENDCSPTLEVCMSWLEDTPGLNHWYYTFENLDQDYNVAVLYNAKKNRIVVASCDTPTAGTKEDIALCRYYQAFAKLQEE